MDIGRDFEMAFKKSSKRILWVASEARCRSVKYLTDRDSGRPKRIQVLGRLISKVLQEQNWN